MEAYEKELNRFWVPSVKTASWGTLDAMRLAVEHLRALGQSVERIGVEASFLPADAYMALQDAMPDSEIVDALVPLELTGAQDATGTSAPARGLRPRH